MTGNLDAFCERCGKTAAPELPAAAPGSQNVLRRFLGAKQPRVEPDPTAALRLCLGCRGYICAECWNEEAAVCQTCQPLAGVGVPVQSDMSDELVAPGLEIVDEAPPADEPRPVSVWPASDLMREQFPALEAGPIAEFEPAATQSDEPLAEFEPPAPPTEETALETSSAADAEERWIELLGRVQAVGAAPEVEGPAVDADVVETEPVAEAEAEATTEAEQPVDAVQALELEFEDVEPVADVEPAATVEAGAAVVSDTDASPTAESRVPDPDEPSRVLHPRRNRRRAARQLPRRPVRPHSAVPPAPPTMTFAAEQQAELAGPPPPPRVPKLPPALPPRSSVATQPWPMPSPPGFLPPPPPPTMSAIQPAPARFRPQVVPVELPKPPATKACANCGLELSAKVMFCRRCGSRQPEST